MKKIVLFLLVLFSLSLQAQKSINIACTDFTFNDKKSIDGKNTTDIFESALMQSTPLIRLLERKKLDSGNFGEVKKSLNLAQKKMATEYVSDLLEYFRDIRVKNTSSR